MNFLSFNELAATLAIWRDESRPVLGMFVTLGQVVVGWTKITPGELELVLTITTVIKSQKWSLEDSIERAAVTSDALVTANHSATFKQPLDPSFIEQNFDEQVHITLRSDPGTIALYRASAFKARPTRVG